MPIVVTYYADAARSIAGPGGSVQAFWLRLLAAIDRNAKRKLSGPYAKVQTGNLRSSQQVPFLTMRGPNVVGVAQNTASYATAVHEGTRPHTIRPVRAKVLTGWSFEGSPVFTKMVNHPGTRPRPWLRDAMTEELRLARMIK